MANEVNVKVTSGSNSAKVSVGGSTIIATTTAASNIKIAKLEDNIWSSQTRGDQTKKWEGTVINSVTM